MGLAGRKEKQRIGVDPRNLSWADDASRFGSAYLAKFGWDSSKGLGATGDGRTSHIKVAQKLDMMGIGAANMRDPNGIAWKQNKDFESLLRRLNGEGGDQEHENGGTKVVGFVSHRKNGDEEEEVAEKGAKKKDKKERQKDEKEDKKERFTESKKKKKQKEKEDSDLEGRKKRKRKDKEGKEHKSKKQKTDNNEERKARESQATSTPSTLSAPIIPRHRAHRARAIAAKKMLSNSATALSEILGIAPIPTPSIIPSGPTTPHGRLTTLDNDITAEKITTSTKSVADYFREKLLSKSGSSTPTYDATRGGLGSSQNVGESETSGLGMFPPLSTSEFLAASFVSSTQGRAERPDAEVEETKDISRRRKKENKEKTKDVGEKKRRKKED